MQRTYDDAVKQKSREKLREYLAKYLLSTRSPKQVSVVCFPGAEVKGEEALEVLEVYDSLGIPRENIVGLEYNKDAAERLKSADLGLEVVCQDSHDFFKTTERKFDVISLDYTGQRTWKERDTTRYIAGRRVLNARGVFCTNHAIKRESRRMQQSLLSGVMGVGAISNIYDSIDPTLVGSSAFQEQYKAQIDLFNKEMRRLRQDLDEGKIPLDEIRHAITCRNLAIFGKGVVELDPKKSIFANNASVIQIALGLVNESSSEKLQGLDLEVPLYMEYEMALQHAFNAARRQLVNLGFNNDIAQRALQTISTYHHKAYCPRNLERYTYTSNKNYKMLMDIFQVMDLPRKWVRDADALLNLDRRRGRLRPVAPILMTRKQRKILERFASEADPSFFSTRVEDPMDLGSSWKPPERISKEDAVMLLQSGVAVAEIEACFHGLKGESKNRKSFRSQLAALKAHYLTMGKDLS